MDIVAPETAWARRIVRKHETRMEGDPRIHMYSQKIIAPPDPAPPYSPGVIM
jgi:hypothetical protein